jgi:hypothetical protein
MIGIPTENREAFFKALHDKYEESFSKREWLGPYPEYVDPDEEEDLPPSGRTLDELTDETLSSHENLEGTSDVPPPVPVAPSKKKPVQPIIRRHSGVQDIAVDDSGGSGLVGKIKGLFGR